MILRQPFYTNLCKHPFYVILRWLNDVCQSSSLSSEMLDNNAADFHKKITLLNFNKF